MSKISYTLVRTKRKSIALVIDANGNLIIRAPRNASKTDISAFVEKKRLWILEKQQQVSQYPKHKPLRIEDGESILYLGNLYTVSKAPVSEISFLNQTIVIPEAFENRDVIAWLKCEAKRIVSARAVHFAQIMGVRYSSIKVTEAKSRWGSCSGKNNVNFAWRLIHCPIEAIDYVVVHELCHIPHKNHGSEFWAAVRTILPNYGVQQDWLKQNRKLMDIV